MLKCNHADQLSEFKLFKGNVSTVFHILHIYILKFYNFKKR